MGFLQVDPQTGENLFFSRLGLLSCNLLSSLLQGCWTPVFCVHCNQSCPWHSHSSQFLSIRYSRTPSFSAFITNVKKLSEFPSELLDCYCPSSGYQGVLKPPLTLCQLCSPGSCFGLCSNIQQRHFLWEWQQQKNSTNQQTNKQTKHKKKKTKNPQW